MPPYSRPEALPPASQPPSRQSSASQAALSSDAARIGAELVRRDGGTDPFAAAVRATRMPMIVTDPRQPDNPVVFANGAFCRLTGYAREEILGRNCRFLQGPETDRDTVARIRAAVGAAQPIEIDVRNHRKDGQPFWNRLLLAPVRDASGEVAYFFASQVDVTLERERLAGLESHNAALMAEVADRVRALEESEARFRHMADSAPALIWMTGADGQVSFANMHFGHVFGRPAADVLGRAWSRLVLREDLHGFRTSFVAAFRTRRTFRAEVRARDREGAVRWLRCEGVPRLDDRGTFLGYTGCAVDITEARLATDALEARVAERTAELSEALGQLHAEVLEREQAEEALRQAQKMEAVGQLTGGIAHDFNNMLQAVGGALHLAGRRVGQGRAGEVGPYLDVALKGVERAAALTARLLAFARRQALDAKPVVLDALVQGMVELIRRTVGPSIEVRTCLHDGDWTVSCDANQLENALLNLAINARDAMGGGGTLTLATAERRLGASDVAGHEGAGPGEYVEVSVEDTGSGMDEATRARAFDPFFTTKPLGQGTGLGLSQVYGFVRQSGGFVCLESVPGQGTAARLYLPRRHEAEQARDGQQTAAAQPAQEAAAGAGRTVLLVEDELEVRELTAAALAELGYRVLDAVDGSEALRLLGSAGNGGNPRVDVLVTDVGLPGGMNGRQLADAARERLPGLPVLFITGYAGRALEEQLAPGMEVIGKPFTLDALAARVRSALDRAPACRAPALCHESLPP